MRKTACFTASRALRRLLLCCALLPVAAPAAPGAAGELLGGHYAREGNDASPAQTAGNNIYLKFFDDRWLAMLFVPWAGSRDIDPGAITRALAAARERTSSAAYLKGRFGVLEQEATAQIERYGYLDGDIAFECDAFAPCTIELGDGYLLLRKPGVINEHIVRYRHVAAE